jgi:hypothetical protein
MRTVRGTYLNMLVIFEFVDSSPLPLPDSALLELIDDSDSFRMVVSDEESCDNSAANFRFI